MKLTFHGAARTVTGSKHLIQVNGVKLLLDCGMFQGKRAEAYDENLNFKFDAAQIDLVVLSHAHIDHSGSLPGLYKAGFRGDIICTPATRDLCAAMLSDSGFIQEKDVEFINKRGRKHGDPPVEPIYTQKDALEVMAYFTTQSYYRARTIAPGVTLTYVDAGHMLGSASVILDIEDRAAGRDLRLVFSGDIGRRGIPIIRDPDTIDSADILIMESTYGDRFHEDVDDSLRRLETIVVETYRRGGSIVMPAFAVGRTQQLVYMLHQLWRSGDIPPMPIFVDSPLAVNITSVFELHPECYDAETREFIGREYDPFGFQHLTYVRSVEDSKRLNFRREPCIIVSASGMAEFGRVLHHLAHRIDNPANTVLITGWQAPNTLGRRLVDGEERVRILGDEYRVQAQVEVINGFSGHADKEELLEWASAIQKKPQRVFLVHGEEAAAAALQAALRSEYGWTVDVPEKGQMFQL
ncbi:MAG: MBL fold metallo-hydrolase [Chloroflexi bacterium]|nr:MBL fold metallo-hydrolase [Chloroflexota bacterium]